MSNNLFAIGIPTINRADLLNPTLEKYLIDFPATQISIVDNGNQRLIEHERITIHRPGENLGVARSWNYLCRCLFNKLDKPNALILNDDVYLGKFEHQVAECIEMFPEESLLVSTGTWCSFLLPARTFGRIGEFDENFLIAYFEDNDYAYRLKLAGIPHFPTKGITPLKVIRNSGSVERDRSLNRMFEHNRLYYIEKWGGPPGQEKYTIPFNGKKKDAIIHG